MDKYNDRKEAVKATPFGKTFIDGIERDSSKVERQFLANMITSANLYKQVCCEINITLPYTSRVDKVTSVCLQISDMTASQAISVFEKKVEEQAQLPSLDGFKKKLKETYPKASPLHSSEVRPVVLDPVGPTAVAKLASFIDDGTREAKQRSMNVPRSAQLTGSMPEFPVNVEDLPAPRTNLNQAFVSSLGIPGQGHMSRKFPNDFTSFYTSTDPTEIIKEENATRYGDADVHRTDSMTSQYANTSDGVLYENQMDLLNVQGFSPPFARPPPPLLAVDDSEYSWLLPLEPIPLIWDNGSMEGQKRVQTEEQKQMLQQLLQTACKEPLPPHYVEKVNSLLESDSVSTIQSTITPDQLPSLVENNPWVTISCLQQLLKASQADNYLLALVNMEISLHSMEVVNRLTAESQVPKYFLHLYISNCISTCENIQDPYMQTRLVRLVCVFLQSLLRNRIIDVSDLLVEVQAFCINFSRIKEANALYKLMKSMS